MNKSSIDLFKNSQQGINNTRFVDFLKIYPIHFDALILFRTRLCRKYETENDAIEFI